MEEFFLKKRIEKNQVIDKIKSMKINEIFNKLTRDAWKSNVQYKVIYKDQRKLDILLMGSIGIYFFKYEKIESITSKEIGEFEKQVKNLNVDKGYYIITGETLDNNLIYSKVVTEDIIQFTKHQKNYKNINFYRYMPG